MKKFSKRYNSLKQTVLEQHYSLDNALILLKTFGTTKFMQSTEIHIALNINPKQTQHQIRTSITLPHGSGKQKKIAVLTDEEKKEEMIKNGAYLAGNESLFEHILSGKLDFDILLTTPALMPKLATLGKILGPKGLMPSPKLGTVTSNLLLTLSEFAKGKMEYRTDKTGIIHCLFGNLLLTTDQLKENFISIYQSILKQKPNGFKGRYIKSVNVCSTMSPNIPINFNTIQF